MIDVVLHEEAVVTHVMVQTGFHQTEERSGDPTAQSFTIFVLLCGKYECKYLQTSVSKQCSSLLV